MVERFSKFWLKEKEEKGIELVHEDIRCSRIECENSVIKVVWENKGVNFSGL